MDIFMRGVALAATEDDVKVELAKILHKAPFPLEPPLNFGVKLFKRHDSRGKCGIVNLPNESAGHTFLRAYAMTGLPVKGARIMFSPSKHPLDQELVAILNSRPWRDPRQLQAEKERRIREGRPYQLKSCAFGRFLADGTFSSEFGVEGSADIACDLERRVVRFTVREQSQRSNSDDDPILTYMVDLMLECNRAMVASYPSKSIDAILDSVIAKEPTLFIRADRSPCFAVENTITSSISDRTDTRRAQGLVPDVNMPAGCFSLACTFVNGDDKDAFIYAARSRFHIKCISKTAPIPVKTTPMNRGEGFNLDYLKDLPFELAFEVEKAITNWTLSPFEALSLLEELKNLCSAHGDAAAQIFRRFVSLLEDKGAAKRQPAGRERRGRRHRNSAPPTLESRLTEAVELYLEEQQRPRGRFAPALPGTGISYSYHLILTPTRHILEGPTADQSNSVLRRFGHHENFLRVSFQDEDRSKLRRDLDMSITDLLGKRYRPLLLNGCKVAGRSYQMLGYSMSGLKEHSLWFVTPFYDDEGGFLDAKTIRESLGDFSRLLYQPARLGARWSQAFSATDPSITLKPEEIEMIDDIKSRADKVMTDGCSPISPELATAIWRANQRNKKHPARGRVPSAYQFRLGGGKGMVVQDPTLEGRVVCLRPSQVKFEAPDNRTFDIQSTSLRPKAMYLNRPLIVLMEYLGSSKERILQLQDRSINEAQSVQKSLKDASKVLQQHGLGTSFHLPSLFRNMNDILKVRIWDETEGSLYNDLIANTLHCAETHILRELKYRAHIGVPGSFTLLGVSDEWNCLAEGEIYATVYDEKRKLYEEITGTVAITRSPQIHPGDIQVVTAVRKEELNHLTNVVVFSCRGDRPLSSCLGGGDLDGDDFNLILDPDLIPDQKATPGEYVSLPIKELDRPCGIEDVVDFIFDYIEADMVGQIAISHLRFSDLSEDGPGCADCLKLAELASQAVDFQKTGSPVKFQELPRHRNRTKPDFLAREGADPYSDNWYQSAKLLGQLFRRVPVKDWMPGEWNETDTPSGGYVIEDALKRVGLYGLGLSLAQPSAELQEEMEYLVEDYCEQLLAIATAHTISKNKDIYVSESELVSGTIMANWSDHHRRREAVGSMNLQTHQLVRAVRMEMRGSHDAGHEEQTDEEGYTEDGEWDEEEEDFYREGRQIADAFKRAWAGWLAAESALRGEPGSYGPQSFGLIALGRMLELIKAARLLV